MKRSVLFLFIFACAPPVFANDFEVYRYNNRGAKKVVEGAFYGAYQDLLSALAEDPMNPTVQLNLGLAFEKNEELDKAEKAFLSASELTKNDKRSQFISNFNTGVVRGKKKDIDGALAAYQAALDSQPNSIEAKTNIELLIQSGGGGGGGGGSNQDKQKGGGGSNQPQPPNQGRGNDPQNEKDKPKPQPRPFDSKELTPADVKKILDEIKNQEQAIRAMDYQKSQKEQPRGGKDW